MSNTTKYVLYTFELIKPNSISTIRYINFQNIYFLFQSVGKCTPKWIRYSAKNKNRIRCVHPNCADKKELNFTYAGIMKHIIDTHTSQETSVSSCMLLINYYLCT